MITININPVIFHIGSLAVRWYGLMYAVGIIVGLLIAWPYAKLLMNSLKKFSTGQYPPALLVPDFTLYFSNPWDLTSASHGVFWHFGKAVWLFMEQSSPLSLCWSCSPGETGSPPGFSWTSQHYSPLSVSFSVVSVISSMATLLDIRLIYPGE